MKVSDFDFNLPREFLAEYPTEKRDGSKLLVLNRKTGEIEHRKFSDIHEYFKPGDLLIRNNTRVKAVRYLARKEHLKGSQLEVLLTNSLPGNRQEALIDPLKKVKEGSALLFGSGELIARIEKIIGQRKVILSFVQPESIEHQQVLLKQLGKMPIPRYIRRKPEVSDFDRYQTVFSKEENALAAPTSALHFTDKLFEKLLEKNVTITDLTLEIGLGTFNPIYTEIIQEHRMHSERFTIPKETADTINDQKQQGKRVIALGTTTIRATESAFKNGHIEAGTFKTDIFITPPYSFHVADALITNFHTPRSTLLMLVAAFGGYNEIMKAYHKAIELQYRFYSYGDSMMII